MSCTKSTEFFSAAAGTPASRNAVSASLALRCQAQPVRMPSMPAIRPCRCRKSQSDSGSSAGMAVHSRRHSASFVTARLIHSSSPAQR
jgi:hypothetical protein